MAGYENSIAASRQLIKEHYNQHVDEGISTKQALARRREGPAAPLKQYHNDIKRRLIYRFAHGAEALLDLACGRGGDLHKWKSAQVRFVKGLDLSPKEVEEARRRYGELLQKEKGCSMQAQFEQTDQLGLELWREERQYDAATCMFALHYFFERESSLMMLMQTVAANLKPGGYFFGTVPDGKRVKAHLVKAAGEVSQGHLMLKQEWQGKEAPFGSPYIMEISDTVVQGHEGFSEGSHEYLVFEKVLLSVAKKYGLHPVVNFEDPALDALFEKGDAGKPMKHFYPQYPADADASLAIASELYMAFVLQKVDGPLAVHAPPLPPPDKSLRGANHQQQQHNQQQQRQQQSPTREQRLAGGSSRPPLLQQQQPENALAWRGGGNRKRNADWQLPYQARYLPPQDMPSAYLNVRNEKHLAEREKKGRFVIKLPPLPLLAGPVQVDAYGHPIYPQLPNGAWISTYYDELNYHSQLQQQQQMTAAAAGHGVPPPQPPTMQQQQQQQYGVVGAAGGGGVGSRQQPPQQQQQQQQQQRGVPPPQAPAYPAPPTAAQQAPAAEAAAADAAPADVAAAAGRGRGRGRGRKAAAAAAEGEASAGGVASPTRGRGRGSRGGRTAGSKRARGQSSDGGAAATAAADDAAGDASEPAAAADGDAEHHEAKRPALQQRAAAGKAASAAAAAASKGGGGPLGRSAIPDPLGYKAAVAVDVSQLAPEVLEQLIALAPVYMEQ